MAVEDSGAEDLAGAQAAGPAPREPEKSVQEGFHLPRLKRAGSEPGAMSKPIVSVLIDTYNHERFIEQAIVSVLEQQGVSPAEMEVVVVDDGSTDNTAEVVRKFAPRVRCLSKPNGGQASAFNAGVPETRGEIVSFLDGDDWWAPNKLCAVLEQMGA